MNIINISKLPVQHLPLTSNVVVSANSNVQVQTAYRSGLSIAQIDLDSTNKYCINVPVDSTLCANSMHPIANKTVTSVLNDVVSMASRLSSISVLSNLFNASDFEIANGKISLYNPISIGSFTISPNVCEIGSTVESINCTWTVNKAVDSISQITLDGQTVPAEEAYNPQLGRFNYVLYFDPALQTGKTVSITIVDAKGGSASASKTLDFRQRLYYGSAPDFDFTSIEDLSQWSGLNALTTSLESRIKTPVDVYVNTNEYFYYISPFGSNLQFTVNGFTGGVDLVAEIPCTNTRYSQHEYTYKVYRSERPDLKQKTFIVSKV